MGCGWLEIPGMGVASLKRGYTGGRMSNTSYAYLEKKLRKTKKKLPTARTRNRASYTDQPRPVHSLVYHAIIHTSACEG